MTKLQENMLGLRSAGVAPYHFALTRLALRLNTEKFTQLGRHFSPVLRR